MPSLLIGAYLAIAAAGDVTALLAIGPVAPNLAALAATCLLVAAVHLNRFWFVFALGLFVDLAGFNRLGSTTLIYLLLGYTTLALLPWLPRARPLSQALFAIPIIAALVVGEAIAAWLSGQTGHTFSAAAGLALESTGYTAALCAPLLWLNHWRVELTLGPDAVAFH